MQKEVDLDLRRKVAELDGWTNVSGNTTRQGFHLAGRMPNTDDRGTFFVPEYELSLDSIIEACDRHKIKFDIKTVEYANKETDDYKALYLWEGDGIRAGMEAEGETRAIALCNLFVAVMESRQSEGKEGRDQLVKALTLRRKVATLAGWTDFFIGEVHHELWGKPPLGSSSVKAPHYEEDTKAILSLISRENISWEWQSRKAGDDEFACNSRELTGIFPVIGDTAAIALCNLFIAVMEARLAGENFSIDPKHCSIKLELVKVETPFTRHLLQHIREKANWQIEAFVGRNWIEAHLDISRAVDRLDAMLARKELIQLSSETATKE